MRRYVFSFAMLAIASCLPVAAYADQAQDKKIAESVIQRLQSEKQSGRLKGFSIDLQVENGTLWLSGRVNSKDQQTAALDVARRVPGVKQVVNDLTVAAAPAAKSPAAAVATAGNQMKSQLVGATQTVMKTVGSGVTPAAASAPVAAPAPAQLAPAPAQPVMAQPMMQQPLMQQPMYQQPMYQQPYAAQQGQRPVAFAPAHSVAMANANMPGHHFHHQGGHAAPQPMYNPSAQMGPAARYDSPQMPGYAWPSYAAHPNYAAVTYPKQYSASAWPYIGPFYPYPQVPLGWRKVTMEWDDGWWYLDFKDRHHDR